MPLTFGDGVDRSTGGSPHLQVERGLTCVWRPRGMGTAVCGVQSPICTQGRRQRTHPPLRCVWWWWSYSTLHFYRICALLPSCSGRGSPRRECFWPHTRRRTQVSPALLPPRSVRCTRCVHSDGERPQPRSQEPLVALTGGVCLRLAGEQEAAYTTLPRPLTKSTPVRATDPFARS